MRANAQTRPQETSTERPVFEVQKSSTQRIRVAHKSYRGRHYVDVRLMVVDRAGEFVPTVQGISIRPELLSAVIQGLMLAAREIGGGLHA
ncbi:transcriptional coactivator p15/PC4 family protein [Paraburkholderia tropica]|uniref:transcriptional coactivator p15/PC4 family protein n=1 Tax=Paraburkholderia tropica TaxID=92647 RepID=UPI002AB694D1|nr:transcriptional coactivator p15/PC4 family protein [Paraburkholderia tropica]